MQKIFPSVSILTPTLNSSRTLGACLEAIRRQDYPQDRVEIIIADGGSEDATLEVAARHGALVVQNELRTGEAGKAVALRHATGELVAFIDSDNIVVGEDWLSRMAEPFTDTHVVGAEPMYFIARASDTIVDRYCALAGVNDPFCLFMGNYDKYSAFTGKWTDMELGETSHGDCLTFSLKQALPTIGANGTIYRRSALTWFAQPYFMDIDIPWLIAKHDDGARFAKVHTGIRHLFCSDARQFTMKQTRRIRDLFTKDQISVPRIYPWRRFLARGLAKFLCACILVFPLLCQSIVAYRRTRDRAAFFHPLACWLTLYIYAVNVLFFRGTALSREKWQVERRMAGSSSGRRYD
ncbi:MAG: glycosyltransferase family 2 protein [Vulcanimicrobiaceae bacterium]